MPLATLSPTGTRLGSISQPRADVVGGDATYYIRRWGAVLFVPGAEPSGTAADLLGGIPLTDNNTVTSGAGKVYPLARQYTAINLEYHSLADNAALSSGDIDILAGFWCWFDTLSATANGLACKFTDATHREWALYYDNGVDGAEVAQRLRFKTYLAGGGQAGIVSTAAAPTTAAWHFVAGYRSKTAAQLGISIDGAAYVTQAETGVPADTTANFIIGALTNGGGSYMDGRIGPGLFCKSPPGGLTVALANEIRDRLFNNGNGRQFPFR